MIKFDPLNEKTISINIESISALVTFGTMQPYFFMEFIRY